MTHFLFRYFLLLLLPVFGFVADDRNTNQEISRLIQTFRNDPRGPYQAIRWFCPDGTVLPPDQRCPMPGGIQHALHKESVQKLAKKQKIYLGQILAGTEFPVFWDEANQYDRAKQYLIERYLVATDDGWILQKARYYRGAFQIEDEEDWGRRFLIWLMEKDSEISENYFLIRQLVFWIPHRQQDDRLLRVRSVSKKIAELDQRFMDIRIKIHGHPDKSDIYAVRMFRDRFQTQFDRDVRTQLDQLEADLVFLYRDSQFESLDDYYGKINRVPNVQKGLQALIQTKWGSAEARCRKLADLLIDLRNELHQPLKGADRLTLMDLSLDIENILFRQITEWKTSDLRTAFEKTAVLARAAAGCGFIETWEWQSIAPLLPVPMTESGIGIGELINRTARFSRCVEWSTSTASTLFNPTIQKFVFEPLAAGFVDACLRSSVVLAFGEISGELSHFSAFKSGFNHTFFDLAGIGGMRGLNPGYASGILEVVNGRSDDVTFSSEKIYVLSQPPANLPPVAGLLSVSEGNPVSHIQLLARNLGIPNAVLTPEQFGQMQSFSGMRVFYAVSPKGNVVLKTADNLTRIERQLISGNERKTDKIRVPLEKMDLKENRILNLHALRARDSGVLCGPKAANLAELKFHFPDHVVEGIVIPFGVFRTHLEQTIPGEAQSYWDMLLAIFTQAEKKRKTGATEENIETGIIAQLAAFREKIRYIPFDPDFIWDLETTFNETFKGKIGQIPVFLRSDTNMEDLKDFSGAGLNLTIFNVLDKGKIFQGIRDVWASPYTERSYRWRQKYLTNPENVYPSILIMPSVNLDKSGVMITTGILSGSGEDITVAFNRGVGGAVEGQNSEGYLLREDGIDEILSPSRERQFTILPPKGGVSKKNTGLNQPIVTSQERLDLRDMAEHMRKKLSGISPEPHDIELGFLTGKIWLFQVRPFVQNKKARDSNYLNSLDPVIDNNMRIKLDSSFK